MEGCTGELAIILGSRAVNAGELITGESEAWIR